MKPFHFRVKKTSGKVLKEMADPQPSVPPPPHPEGINVENNHQIGDPIVNNRPRNANNNNGNQQQPVNLKCIKNFNNKILIFFRTSLLTFATDCFTRSSSKVLFGIRRQFLLQ
jgi:hypothetical protein